METTTLLAALKRNAVAIAALARAMPADQVAWRPSPNAWSVVEVVNHLADEEGEDFRARLDFVLHRRAEPPAIHPAEWPATRAYNARDLEESLARFAQERAHSLAWLRSLDCPDWSRAWEVAPGRALHAGDLLASWAAHDLLHMRQFGEIQYAWHAEHAAPYRVAYAGDW